MAVALVCTCGARLEIDDHFAGQVVPCPDCERPLQVPEPKVIYTPRVSGWALTAFIVSLVGGLTLIGSFAGILLGIFARRQITRSSGRLVGLGFTKAALILGGAGLTLLLFLLFSPTVFHLDAIVRVFAWARKLDYQYYAKERGLVRPVSRDVSLVAPSDHWGLLQNSTSSDRIDDFILVDIWTDAQISCQTMTDGDFIDWNAAQSQGLQHFHNKSELVAILGRLKNDAVPQEATPRDVVMIDGETREMFLDLRLGGIDRTFFIQMRKGERVSQLYLLVGAARKHDFPKLLPTFRDAFATFKVINK